MITSFALSENRKSVLVLDDEDSVRRLARRILEGGGYDVHEAATGEPALRIAEKTPALALVVSDVVLPFSPTSFLDAVQHALSAGDMNGLRPGAS